MNCGATGCPLNPPVSSPSIDPWASSPEVTESLTLTTSSSGIEKKVRAGTVFFGVGGAIADVSARAGSSLLA